VGTVGVLLPLEPYLNQTSAPLFPGSASPLLFFHVKPALLAPPLRQSMLYEKHFFSLPPFRFFIFMSRRCFRLFLVPIQGCCRTKYKVNPFFPLKSPPTVTLYTSQLRACHFFLLFNSSVGALKRKIRSPSLSFILKAPPPNTAHSFPQGPSFFFATTNLSPAFQNFPIAVMFFSFPPADLPLNLSRLFDSQCPSTSLSFFLYGYLNTSTEMLVWILVFFFLEDSDKLFVGVVFRLSF